MTKGDYCVLLHRVSGTPKTELYNPVQFIRGASPTPHQTPKRSLMYSSVKFPKLYKNTTHYTSNFRSLWYWLVWGLTNPSWGAVKVALRLTKTPQKVVVVQEQLLRPYYSFISSSTLNFRHFLPSFDYNFLPSRILRFAFKGIGIYYYRN